MANHRIRSDRSVKAILTKLDQTAPSPPARGAFQAGGRPPPRGSRWMGRPDGSVVADRLVAHVMARSIAPRGRAQRWRLAALSPGYSRSSAPGVAKGRFSVARQGDSLRLVHFLDPADR